MSVQERADEVEYETWGDGEVVIHEGDSTGSWIKYDPDDPMFDLDEWR